MVLIERGSVFFGEAIASNVRVCMEMLLSCDLYCINTNVQIKLVLDYIMFISSLLQ